ncbi:unnamed protein product [Calypogeia fissa]
MKSGNENERKPEGSLNNLDRRLNQTLKSVQGLLRVPGKILLSRRGSDSIPPGTTGSSVSSDNKDLDDERTPSPNNSGGASASTSNTDAHPVNGNDGSDGVTGNVGVSSSPFGNSGSKGSSTESSRPSTGGRATDTARVARFKRAFSSICKSRYLTCVFDILPKDRLNEFCPMDAKWDTGRGLETTLLALRGRRNWVLSEHYVCVCVCVCVCGGGGGGREQ